MRAALVLLLALGLAACGRAPEPSPTVAGDTLAIVPSDSAAVAAADDPFPAFARRATALELGLDGYRKVKGTWEAGETAARFTAHFDADTLRFIEAAMDRGDYGEATAVYYFADGAPFYIVQDEQRTRLDPREAGQRDTIQTRAAFAPDGAVVAGEQVVNGEVRDAPLIEIEGLWNHARALAEQADDAARPAL